jgi:hypothetical protein
METSLLRGEGDHPARLGAGIGMRGVDLWTSVQESLWVDGADCQRARLATILAEVAGRFEEKLGADLAGPPPLSRVTCR